MIMRQVKASSNKALGYGRVSTENQDDKTSLGAQWDAVKKEADANGKELVGFLTDVSSGGDQNRPGLQRVMEIALNKINGIDTIYVYDLSRFSRNPEDFFDLYGTLKRHNIQLRSVIEPHMGDEMSELLYSIITIFNSVLLPRIARLVRRGQFKATEQGYWVAKEVPLGYRKYPVFDGKNQHSKLERDPENWDTARRVWDYLLEGRSGKGTAMKMNLDGLRTAKVNLFSTEAVLDIARNEAYLGHVVRGKRSRSKYLSQEETERCDNAHEPMVTQDEWDRVQELIAGRTREARAPRSHGSPNIFSGKVFCGVSGMPMNVHRSNPKNPKLICKGKHLYGKVFCQCQNVDMNQFHELMLSNLLNKVLTRKTFREQVQLVAEQNAAFVEDEEKKNKAADYRITAIKRGKKNLMDSLETYGPHGDIGARLDELTAEQGKLESEVASRKEYMRTRATFVNEPQRIIRNALDMRTYLESDDPHIVAQFANIFVEKVTILNRIATVEYRIPVPARDGEGLVEREVIHLDEEKCVLGVPTGMGATCSTPSTWTDLLLLEGVVKRVCSRSSLPGGGRPPSMTPSSWHSGLLLHAIA